MIGLIWKDILVMRKTLRTYLLFLGFYLAMALVGIFNLSFVVAFIQVIMLMLPISAFSFDEAAKWERYAMALPLSRRTVVGARYLFVLLMLLSAAAFGMAAVVLMSFVNPGDVIEYLATILVSVGVGIWISDVILPISYKLGPERARPYLYAVVFLPIIALFLAFKLGMRIDDSFLDQMPPSALLGLFSLVPLTALAGLGLSFLLSCRIVSRKEY